MKADLSLTLAARRHIRRFLRALPPVSRRLEHQFRAMLRARRYDAARTRALLAITPLAASRIRTLPAFLEEVQYQGRRLSKLNVPPEDVIALLVAFEAAVGRLLDGCHAPAREQLHLITAHTIRNAYYQVREAEAQVFYGLYHAESEGQGLSDFLSRVIRILTRAFGARAGRLLLEPPAGPFAREFYSEDAKLGWGGHSFFWSFPVRAVALIQLGFDKQYPWMPREEAMMRAVAARCAIAIERSRLETAAWQAEEQERRRIGRELHDDTAQSLLLLRLQLEMMERDAPEPLRRRIAQSRQITERAVADLRRFIAALSPALLERLGLERALRQLAVRFGKCHADGIGVKITPACKGLSPDAQEVIYRVAQEALQNAARHSRAKRVNLSLSSADKKFRLRVRDNGVGLSGEPDLGKPMSFGLMGMRERAALLGGTLTIRSAPGKGVSVILNLPRAIANGEI